MKAVSIDINVWPFAKISLTNMVIFISLLRTFGTKCSLEPAPWRNVISSRSLYLSGAIYEFESLLQGKSECASYPLRCEGGAAKAPPRLFILADEKYVKLEHYFVDGTKIEANANRYTFVWGKAVVKQKAKLQEKVQTLFATIEAVEKQEENEQAGQDLAELGEASVVTSEKLEAAVQQLETKLQFKMRT
jgi:hypothetical protein